MQSTLKILNKLSSTPGRCCFIFLCLKKDELKNLEQAGAHFDCLVCVTQEPPCIISASVWAIAHQMEVHAGSKYWIERWYTSPEIKLDWRITTRLRTIKHVYTRETSCTLSVSCSVFMLSSQFSKMIYHYDVVHYKQRSMWSCLRYSIWL